MGGGWQVTVPQLEAWTFSRRARGRGKVGGGTACRWVSRQSLWNGSRGRTWSGQGRGGDVRWDKELFFWRGSWKRGMDAYLCVCVWACLGLPRSEPHALTESFTDAASCWQGSVWVSLVGAQEKQHLQTDTCTHTQIEKDRMDIYYTGVRVTENYLQALQKQTKLHSSLHLGRVIHTHTCYWYSVVRVVFPLFFNHIVWQRSNKRRVWCM